MYSRLLRGWPIVLSGLLLVGVAAERLSLSAPSGVAPYHERVRTAAAGAPMTFAGWEGQDVEVPPAAVKLLKPNVIMSRRFMSPSPGRRVDFLLVQCEDTRELVAHYPPVCYPGRGYRLVSTTPQHLSTDGLHVSWTDYKFVRQSFDEFSSIVASHFIIMPDGHLRASMDAMRTAAARVQDRYYGAAQVHVVFDSTVEPAVRLAILKEMVAAHRELIDAIRLRSGDQVAG